jgi:hypothetical protein
MGCSQAGSGSTNRRRVPAEPPGAPHRTDPHRPDRRRQPTTSSIARQKGAAVIPQIFPTSRDCAPPERQNFDTGDRPARREYSRVAPTLRRVSVVVGHEPDPTTALRGGGARSSGRLYRAAVRLAGKAPDADDLVQETCLRALQAFDQLRDPGAAKG